MRIICDRCREFITDIGVDRDPISGVTKITVNHHGETDSMELTDDWIGENQDFVMMIQTGLTVGQAFKKDPEDDTVGN